MLRTIVTASHISVQGEFVRKLADGRVVVRVGDVTYTGRPVNIGRDDKPALKAVEAA